MKGSEQDLVHGSRVVVPWSDGVVFRCPCDERQCYLASPPHTITFDAEGVLHVEPSIGYKARPDLGRPQNWCHFYLRNGEAEILEDSQCPGAALR